MKSLTAILAPPMLCAGILVGIGLEKSSHVKPKDAEGYHARAKKQIEAMPFGIPDADGSIWNGQEVEPTRAAVQLLKPNIILSRKYLDERQRRCDVLIVQCRDSRDMVGHYPEKCYPNSGDTMLSKTPRDWTVGNLTITGTEYTFERFNRGQPERKVVYNFLVVPGVGIVRDIKGVNKAAEDYQRRHFGAAQFQFVMSDDMPRDERDRIFTTLLSSDMAVFDALNDVKLK